MKRNLVGGLGLVAAGLLVLGLATLRDAFAEPADDRSMAEAALAQVAQATATFDAGVAHLGGASVAGDGGRIGDAAPPSYNTASVADASGPRDPALIRDPVNRAARALERARGARSSGDVHHAELLEGLAREWAETARDVLRADAVEQEATATEVAARAAATRAERARALLEEDVARRGRAQAEWSRVSAGGSPFATTATSAASVPAPRTSSSAAGQHAKVAQ